MSDLQKIRAIANYQFEVNIGAALFPKSVELTYSRKTSRIRHIYFEGNLLATLRPRDGLFSLTIFGAMRLQSGLKPLTRRVIVRKDVQEFIMKGRNVLARHVIAVDNEIRPGSEVLVTSAADELLAIGKASLSGREMLLFNRGTAVKVRHGIAEAL